ncbi:MAG: hypothetical protein ACI898_001328, partial [Flavobacteriales bacterium]
MMKEGFLRMNSVGYELFSRFLYLTNLIEEFFIM